MTDPAPERRNGREKPILGSLEPIWTVAEIPGSAYLMVYLEEMLRQGGLGRSERADDSAEVLADAGDIAMVMRACQRLLYPGGTAN